MRNLGEGSTSRKFLRGMLSVPSDPDPVSDQNMKLFKLFQHPFLDMATKSMAQLS